MTGRSLRFFTSLSKTLGSRTLNLHHFSISQAPGFLNNSEGRRKPLPTVDFLLISMCGGGVMFWNKEIITRLVLWDIEKVHSGCIKLISNLYLSFVWHSLYLPFILRMRKVWTTIKRCLNSEFEREHPILNGSFVTTLIPDPINISQDRKSWKKNVLLPGSTQLSAAFYNYSPLCYPQRRERRAVYYQTFPNLHLLIPLGPYTWRL